MVSFHDKHSENSFVCCLTFVVVCHCRCLSLVVSHYLSFVVGRYLSFVVVCDL